MIAHILHKSLSLKKLLHECIFAKTSSCQSFAYGKEEHEWDQSEVACTREGMKRRANLVIAMVIKERRAEFNFFNSTSTAIQWRCRKKVRLSGKEKNKWRTYCYFPDYRDLIWRCYSAIHHKILSSCWNSNVRQPKRTSDKNIVITAFFSTSTPFLDYKYYCF